MLNTFFRMIKALKCLTSRKLLKNNKTCFSIHLNSFLSFLRYLNVRPDLFDHVGKRLDKRAKVKTYDVIYQKTNNYNTGIFQYLKK